MSYYMGDEAANELDRLMVLAMDDAELWETERYVARNIAILSRCHNPNRGAPRIRCGRCGIVHDVRFGCDTENSAPSHTG